MKRPRNGLAREIGDEVLCFVLGHRWKSSWRSRDDRAAREAIPETDWPYAWRQAGNPFFCHSAGWDYKCRRCRLRIRGDSWHPWYKVLWWATTTGFSDLQIGLTCYRPSKATEGYNHAVYPRWAWPLSWLVAPLFGFMGWYGHLMYCWRFPFFPYTLTGKAFDRVSEFIESKRTTLYWHPPQDPTDPFECGFHSLSEKNENPTFRFFCSTQYHIGQVSSSGLPTANRFYVDRSDVGTKTGNT